MKATEIFTVFHMCTRKVAHGQLEGQYAIPHHLLMSDLL